MFKKTLVFLLLLNTCIFAEQHYTFEPKAKVQLRYAQKLKHYSPLGKALLKTNKTKYNDYIYGGILGGRTIFDSTTLNTSGYGIGRLRNKNIDPLKNENTYYNNDLDGFLFLGELNVKKEFLNHAVKIGRQSYNSPLVNPNYRITQNSYEGINYSYIDKNKNFDFQSLYFYKVASSTMANSVPYNHKYGFLGYGMGYDSSEFEHLSTHIINKKLSTNGALHFLMKHHHEKYSVTFENLYVDNFFNTTNLQLAYNLKDLSFKVGFISQSSIGKDHLENHIEQSQSGKKLSAKHYQMQAKYQKEGFSLTYSIAHTPSNDENIYSGTLYSPFSNQPSWLVGINTNHATISDTTSQSLLVMYQGAKLYKIPLVLANGYIQYDIGKDNGLSQNSLKTSELYYHIKGYFSKNLSSTLQYSYVKNMDPLIEKVSTTKLILTYHF